MASEDDLVKPLEVSGYRFQKFGCVQFSQSAYTGAGRDDGSLLVPYLPVSTSLLALSSKFCLLFIVKSDKGLYVAETRQVYDSVEEDKKQQLSAAVDKKGGHSSRIEDAAVDEKIFHAVNLEGNDAPIVGLSLNSSETYLAVITIKDIKIIPTNTFQFVTNNSPPPSLTPTHILPRPSYVSAHYTFQFQWSTTKADSFYTLVSDSSDESVFLSYYQIQSHSQHPRLYFSPYKHNSSPLRTITESPFEPASLYAGTQDGTLLHFKVTDQQLSLVGSYPSHQPSELLKPSSTLQFISFLSSTALLLGYSDPTNPGSDPAAVAVSLFNTSSRTYTDFGDPTIESDRLERADEYKGNHHFHIASIRAWRCGLLYSNYTAQPSLIGPTMGKEEEKSGGSYIPYSIPDDEDRIVIPLDKDYNDTYPLGLAIDYSNQISINQNAAPESAQENEAPEGAISKKPPGGEGNLAFPMLCVLTSDNRLHMWNIICSIPSESKASAQVMIKPDIIQPNNHILSTKPNTPPNQTAVNNVNLSSPSKSTIQPPALAPSIGNLPAVPAFDFKLPAVSPFPSSDAGTSFPAFSFSSSSSSSSPSSLPPFPIAPFRLPLSSPFAASSPNSSGVSTSNSPPNSSAPSSIQLSQFPVKDSSSSEKSAPPFNFNGNSSFPLTKAPFDAFPSSLTINQSTSLSLKGKPPPPSSAASAAQSKLPPQQPLLPQQQFKSAPPQTQGIVTTPPKQHPSLSFNPPQSGVHSTHSPPLTQSQARQSINFPLVEPLPPSLTRPIPPPLIQPSDLDSRTSKDVNQQIYLDALRGTAENMRKIAELRAQTSAAIGALPLPNANNQKSSPYPLNRQRMFNLSNLTKRLLSTSSALEKVVQEQAAEGDKLIQLISESIRLTENARTTLARREDPAYQEALLNQPLDPALAQLQDSLNQKVHTLTRSLDELEESLQAEWDLLRKKEMRGGVDEFSSSYNGETLTNLKIKQILTNHARIIANQQMELSALESLLYTYKHPEFSGIRPLFTTVGMKRLQAGTGRNEVGNSNNIRIVSSDSVKGSAQLLSPISRPIIPPRGSPSSFSPQQSPGLASPPPTSAKSRIESPFAIAAGRFPMTPPTPNVASSAVAQLSQAFAQKLAMEKSGRRKSASSADALSPPNVHISGSSLATPTSSNGTPYSDSAQKLERTKARSSLRSLFAQAESPKFRPENLFAPLEPIPPLPPAEEATKRAEQARRWSRTFAANKKEETEEEKKNATSLGQPKIFSPSAPLSTPQQQQQQPQILQSAAVPPAQLKLADSSLKEESDAGTPRKEGEEEENQYSSASNLSQAKPPLSSSAQPLISPLPTNFSLPRPVLTKSESKLNQLNSIQVLNTKPLTPALTIKLTSPTAATSTLAQTPPSKPTTSTAAITPSSSNVTSTPPANTVLPKPKPKMEPIVFPLLKDAGTTAVPKFDFTTATTKSIPPSTEAAPTASTQPANESTTGATKEAAKEVFKPFSFNFTSSIPSFGSAPAATNNQITETVPVKPTPSIKEEAKPIPQPAATPPTTQAQATKEKTIGNGAISGLPGPLSIVTAPADVQYTAPSPQSPLNAPSGSTALPPSQPLSSDNFSLNGLLDAATNALTDDTSASVPTRETSAGFTPFLPPSGELSSIFFEGNSIFAPASALGNSTFTSSSMISNSSSAGLPQTSGSSSFSNLFGSSFSNPFAVSQTRNANPFAVQNVNNQPTMTANTPNPFNPSPSISAPFGSSPLAPFGQSFTSAAFGTPAGSSTPSPYASNQPTFGASFAQTFAKPSNAPLTGLFNNAAPFGSSSSSSTLPTFGSASFGASSSAAAPGGGGGGFAALAAQGGGGGFAALAGGGGGGGGGWLSGAGFPPAPSFTTLRG